MNHVELIQRGLADLFGVEAGDDFIRVTTQCMYPGGGLVQLAVRCGEDTFVVSDDGGAIRQIYAAGASLINPDKMINPMLKQMGLKIGKGIIRAPACSSGDVAYSIAIVANASKAVADWLFSHVKIRPHYNFKEVVSNFLAASFQDNVRPETIVGNSNKLHKFDHIIRGPNGKQIIVDTVLRDSNSINARFAANMDVKNAGLEDVEQRIVYDDNDDWPVADLNLLRTSAALVRFSKAPEVFQRLVANGR